MLSQGVYDNLQAAMGLTPSLLVINIKNLHFVVHPSPVHLCQHHYARICHF